MQLAAIGRTMIGVETASTRLVLLCWRLVMVSGSIPTTFTDVGVLDLVRFAQLEPSVD